MALRTPLMGLFDVLDDEEASLSAVKAELDDQQRRLNPLAMDKTQPLAIKWTALQAKFEYNLPVRLLEWLRRILSLGANSRVLDRPTSACIGAAIRLMQTCLLLHPRSNVLFARPAAWKTMLRLLERSVTASSAADRLTLAVLELILFALIDRPKNMRQFESSSCLARVVTCFKDKTASHAVRLKSLEILYYYMLPETAASPLTSYAGSEGWSRADYPPSPAASSAGSQGTPFFPSASDMSRIRLEVLETPQKPRMSQAHSSGETPRSSSHFARSPSSCSLAATPAHEATRREQSDSRSQSRLSMSDIPRTPRRSMLSPQADQTPTKSGGGGLTRSDSQRALASITNAASALASRMSLSASKQDRRRNSIDFSTRTRPNVSERGSSFDLDRPNRASDQNMPPPSLPPPAPSGLVRSRSTLLSPLSSSSSHQHAHRRSRSSFVMSDITEEHQQNLHSLSSLQPPLQASKMHPSPSMSEIAQHKSKFQLREANVDGTRDPHAKKDLLKCFLSSAQLERLERSFTDLAVTKSR